MNQPALYEALLIARVLLVSLATLTVSLVILGAFRRQKSLVGRRPTSFYGDQRRLVAGERVPRKGARANHL
jgi:hypothetical protein